MAVSLGGSCRNGAAWQRFADDDAFRAACSGLHCFREGVTTSQPVTGPQPKIFRARPSSPLPWVGRYSSKLRQVTQPSALANSDRSVVTT